MQGCSPHHGGRGPGSRGREGADGGVWEPDAVNPVPMALRGLPHGFGEGEPERTDRAQRGPLLADRAGDGGARPEEGPPPRRPRPHSGAVFMSSRPLRHQWNVIR